MALDNAGTETTGRKARHARGPLWIISYPLRFAFRLIKRSLAGVLRVLAYHPVSTFIIIILLAAIGVLGYQDYASPARIAGGGVSEATLPPSPAAENFIKGQETFDASLIWVSLSDSLKQQLSSRGTSQQSIQQDLDQRKQAGNKVDQVQYVGGTETADGARVFMYELTIDTPNSQTTAKSQHYVLTVDQSDKIISVE